jgi:ribosome maturation factor RimP
MVQDITGQLRAAAARVAGTHGLDIFDVQFRREPSGWVLRVMIDRPWSPEAPSSAPGSQPEIGIEDCQRVSRDLSALLDVESESVGLPDVKYTLEVSSPGLDRPLRGELDYWRFEGRLAKIVTIEPVAGQTSFAGRLAGVEAGEIQLTEGRRTHRIPIALVKRARLDVEF